VRFFFGRPFFAWVTWLAFGLGKSCDEQKKSQGDAFDPE
jgi:hypothetical protein